MPRGILFVIKARIIEIIAFMIKISAKTIDTKAKIC